MSVILHLEAGHACNFRYRYLKAAAWVLPPAPSKRLGQKVGREDRL
jgi:hypothetical protein